MPKKEQKYSNVVPVKEFIFLTIISLGIYEMVWFYRNWKFFKEKESLDISPFWRSFFGIFFLYNLLSKIRSYAKKSGYNGDYSPSWETFYWIIISLPGQFVSGPLTLISYFRFFALFPALKAMNFYYDKTEKNCIRRPWKWQHFLLILLCMSLWVFIIRIDLY